LRVDIAAHQQPALGIELQTLRRNVRVELARRAEAGCRRVYAAVRLEAVDGAVIGDKNGAVGADHQPTRRAIDARVLNAADAEGAVELSRGEVARQDQLG